MENVLDHPILRRPKTGFRDYVLVGALESDWLKPDEVWSRSPRFVTDLLRTLDEEEIWTRGEWERDIIKFAITSRTSSFKSTAMRLITLTTSLIAERVFLHLVAEGVMRRPTQQEFRAFSSLDEGSKRHWIPDAAKRDDWAAVRLLLLGGA